MHRAVVGEYQPHRLETVKVDKGERRRRMPNGDAIPNYYPAIVPLQTFNAVQRRKQANVGGGGRNGKGTNVFKNLVRCGYCGGPMVFVDKSHADHKHDWRYLMCDTARRGLRLWC